MVIWIYTPLVCRQEFWLAHSGCWYAKPGCKPHIQTTGWHILARFKTTATFFGIVL